jgi:ferritin-like metal-binding protein YciE
MARTMTLDDLFLDTLKDIYYAEKKILKTLPKMAKAAQSDKLRKGFEKHLAQTEEQVTRLEQVFESIGQPPRGKKCEAIEGIVAEGDSIMKEYKGTEALDAGLISSAQAVEHYEITRYGTLRRWAEMMGNRNAARLLEKTLKEESQTDELLNQIAESANREAQGDKPARRSASSGKTAAKSGKAASKTTRSGRGKSANAAGKGAGQGMDQDSNEDANQDMDEGSASRSSLQ